MANLTQEVFDTTASTYDSDRSLLLPSCDTFYRWAIDLVPPYAQHILDLGAGSASSPSSSATIFLTLTFISSTSPLRCSSLQKSASATPR